MTDDLADGVGDVPTGTEADRDFLLSAINVALRDPLVPEDVLGSFAGLRPLLAGAASASTADLSRRHRILEGPQGLLTVVGGKLTTARRMAQDVVDRITARPGIDAGPCVTSRRPLVGAGTREQLSSLAAPPHLIRRFGTEAAAVMELTSSDPGLAKPILDGLPYLLAELAWAVEREGALTMDDLLERRTRIGLVDYDRTAVEARVRHHIALPAPP